MPELLECRLDRIGKFYRWQALFTVPNSNAVHTIAVSHDDAEMAAWHLGNMVESVLLLFSKEYGRA